MTTVAKIVLSLLVGSAVLWGQVGTTGQINGTVRDSSGSVVPDAAIKVTQTATGLVRNVNAGADGSFVITNLPSGPYLVEVTRDGFNKYVQSGVILQVDSSATVDASLKPGSITEQVTVEANASMVETHSSGVGTVIDNQRILEMPLNGRNVTELIFLAGAANIGGANGGFLNSVRNYPTVMISVAGGVANWTTFNWDGANHNDAYNSLNLPMIFPDALQEFKVESGSLPAQYGMHASATVNAITKSGTNNIHGDLFEFLRNGDLNARDFFAPKRDTLKRNQFGGTIGGRIIKDKLFYFAGYQGTTQRSEPGQNPAFVPSEAMLNGDFTTFAKPISQGGCQPNQVTLKAPFSGNKIDPKMFSAAALKVESRLPVATDPCGQVKFGLLANQDEHMGVAKVDYQMNDKQTMYVRAFVTNLEAPSTYDGKNGLTLNSNAQHNRVYSLAFGHTYVISPTMVNSFRAGANRSEIIKVPDNFATWPELGVNAPYNPSPTPRIAVTGGNGYNIGGGSSIINIDAGGPNPSIADDVSWVKGSHQIGFGGSYLHTLLNYQSGINSTGLMQFNGTVTGLGLADFLIGRPSNWTQGNLQGYLYNRQQYVSLFAQDSWKMNSRLTLSYGVRWEPFFAFTNKYGWFDHFDPALFAQNVHSTLYPNAPAGLIFPGDSQWTAGDHSIASNRYGVFLPRLGIAWDPTGSGKTSIRASVGMFTDRGALYSMSAMAQDTPYGNVVAVPSPASMADPWASIGGNPLPLTLSTSLKFPTAASFIADNLNWKPTWVNQFNFSIQRQIGTDWVVTANYIGNTVSHLITEGQINPAVYLGTGPCSFPAAGALPAASFANCGTTTSTSYRRLLYRQNPVQGSYYGIISTTDDGGTSSYNALYLQAQKRFSKGTSVLANYTWSHCIGDLWNGNPGNNGVSTVTPFDRRHDRGNCNIMDQRQVFNLSVVAQTPRFSNRILRLVGSDWQFAPSMRIKSSQFYSVVTGTDSALNGENSAGGVGERVDPVAGVSPYLSRDSGCPNAPCVPWANRSAYVVPAAPSTGTVAIFSQKGPGVFQLDVALSRTFKVREGKLFQVRAEAFNLPNHLNLTLPGVNSTGAFANPAFNNPATFTITSDISGTSGLSSGDYRVVQLALKFLF